jgi:arylsulfatase A-like enzyme
MKRHLILVLFTFCLYTAWSQNNLTRHRQADVKKPNVILILTDDQGDGDMECHGSPYVKTPAINELYRQSVRFTDFHVDPSCSPTRSALLTGCYSSRAGVWHTTGGRSLLKEGMPTLADLFKTNGYETAIFGKWHLGENYPFRPQDRGFKESVVFGGGLITDNPDYWGNDYFDDTYRHNGKYQEYKGYCNTVWFTQAIDYIKKNKDKPFFCYLATNVPHAPLRVEEKYVQPYKGMVSDRLAHYYGMISKFDEDLGHFMTELKDIGADDNTILIFMTDNGPCPWFGGIVIDFKTGFVKEGYSEGMRGGKIWGYENAHRTPLFIRWPKGHLAGGKDISALAAQIDLMPTLIDLCALKTPDTLRYDGRSLVPLLNNTITGWSDDRTIIVHNQRVDYPVKDKEYQVITQKWRLVRREKDELYDITNDPGEQNDIAAQYPDTVKQLYQRYQDWWDYVSTDFDKYSCMYIGSKHENPVTLYAQDAHRRKGKLIWVVKVAKDGEYKIRMNRWPDESGKKIVENRNGDQNFPVTTASLWIGNLSLTKTVTKEMRSAEFVVNLKAGETCIETALNLEDGKLLPAAYVYVKYQGSGERSKLDKYIPSDPDSILKKGYVENVEPFN